MSGILVSNRRKSPNLLHLDARENRAGGELLKIGYM
jgi:hypothetical protein